MADREKALRAQQTFRVVVRVEVRKVGNVVSPRFQPVGERELPEEPFTRTGGKRRVEDLAVFAVGTIETDLNVRPPVPLVLAIVIEGELARPTVIGLPGRVGTLKDEISRAIVAHNEDHIALNPLAERCEFAEINAA